MAMISERTKALAGEGEAVTVFNTLGFDRNDIVSLPENVSGALADDEGHVYPVQTAGGKNVAYVAGLPSKGYKSFKVVENADAAIPFTRNGNSLETPFYSVTFDENGLFTSIFDKKNDREILQDNKKGNLFTMYEDKPIYYDNWDIDIFYTEKKWDAEAPFLKGLKGYENVRPEQQYTDLEQSASYTLYGDIKPYLYNGTNSVSYTHLAQEGRPQK